MAASRPHKPYKSRQIRGADLFPWKRRRNRPTSCLMGMTLVFHTLPFFWPQESGLCLFRKHERPSAFSSPYVSASLVSRMKLPTPTSRDVFPLPRVFYCLTALQIFATNLVSKALNGTNICRPGSLATITSQSLEVGDCKIRQKREDTCSGIGLRVEGLSQAPCLDQMMSIWPEIAIHHLCSEFSVI